MKFVVSFWSTLKSKQRQSTLKVQTEGAWSRFSYDVGAADWLNARGMGMWKGVGDVSSPVRGERNKHGDGLERMGVYGNFIRLLLCFRLQTGGGGGFRAEKRHSNTRHEAGKERHARRDHRERRDPGDRGQRRALQVLRAPFVPEQLGARQVRGAVLQQQRG